MDDNNAVNRQDNNIIYVDMVPPCVSTTTDVFFLCL